MKRLLMVSICIVFSTVIGWLVLSDTKAPVWPEQGAFDPHG